MNKILSYKNLSPLTWTLFISYIILFLFFNKIDVYHHYFFSTGLLTVTYNLFRIFFIFCLMWLCYVIGDYVLLFLTKETAHHEITLKNVILNFFVGLSIWHILLLFFGFAGLYQRYLMEIITAGLFIVSLPRLNDFIGHLSKQKSSLYWPGLLLFLLPTFLFFITKGLYPSGGHDYFTHYFPYYREVIETGSIMPGSLWYHFYYDKGMGLFFLSMLLTDPLAPQLVTTAMIFATAGIIFSLVREATTWRLLPWIGMALYLAFLIYTPGPPDAMHETGWGDLEKSHEPATILMFFIIWATIYLAQIPKPKLWGIALILSASALAIMSAAMAVFAGVYLSAVMLFFIFYKKKSAALYTIASMVAIGVWLSLLLLINYLLTGLPDEQTVLLWWSVIDFDKVNEWGGLFQLINLNFWRVGQAANKIPINFELINRIITYLRFDIWGPLLVMVLASIVYNSKLQCHDHAKAIPAKIALYACGGFLLLIACLSFIIGRDQPVSFYRFTSFTYAPTLCFCLLLLAMFLSEHKKWSSFILILGVIAALSTIGNKHHIPFLSEGKYEIFCYLLLLSLLFIRVLFNQKMKPFLLIGLGFLFIWLILHMPLHNKNLSRTITNGTRFVTGQYSIADAYKHQQGWPGRLPWGGIYPPMEIIWRKLPPKTRIWSWHIHSYCMLPDCDVEEFTSFQMSPHEDVVYFGDPEKAKEHLKKENLNYFFFSNVLGIRDPFSLSPLFSPQHIAEYLGIVWTDGNNTLLTWKEQAQFPINNDWLRRYQKNNQVAEHIIHYDKIKKILEIKDMQIRNHALRTINFND